jgi:hypothetical protein
MTLGWPKVMLHCSSFKVGEKQDCAGFFEGKWAPNRLCAAASMRTILEREPKARSKEPARRRALGQE